MMRTETADLPPTLVGSALVSNTTVCEASRLFGTSYPNWTPLSRNGSQRLSDLFSLIDALVLHEQLYTLPCSLDDHNRNLTFRQRLINAGVLQELDTSSFHPIISRLMVDSLAQVSSPVFVAGSGEQIGRPLKFASLRGDIEIFLDWSGKTQPTKAIHWRNALTYQDNPEEPITILSSIAYPVDGGTSEIQDAATYDEMGRALIGWLEYASSGAYEACTSILRDMYYIYTSEALSIPYWPQSDRMEFARKFPNYYDADFRVSLYAKLAEALKVTIDEIQDEFRDTITYIPPFSSIALEMSNSPNELMDRVLELRGSYSTLRENLASIEMERRSSKTLKKRKQLISKKRKMLEQLSAGFDKPNTVTFESVIRYVPELIKPATAPHDPTKYSANLLLQPIEWIVDWWQRRPIGMFFEAETKISNIQGYEHLIARVFGTPI